MEDNSVSVYFTSVTSTDSKSSLLYPPARQNYVPKVKLIKVVNVFYTAPAIMQNQLDPVQFALSLPGYLKAMQSQPRREYAEPWKDWPNPNSPANQLPVVYALWTDLECTVPIYVGQTVNLWKRLSEHFYAKGWVADPRYVSFIEFPEFDQPIVVTVVEKFLIGTMAPTVNDPRK